MGYLFYGNTQCPINVPDRVLAHVKVVATTKLRRNESFTVSWRHPDGAPRGRSTIWMHPSIPLRFVFETAESEILDPGYLRDLAFAAGSSNGMMIDVEVVAERVDTNPVLKAASSVEVAESQRKLAPAR